MKYIFVILSNQPYNQPLKTNKYHVATILASKGMEVIFVDPPLRFKAVKSFLKLKSLNIIKLFSNFVLINNLNLYTSANFFNFKPFSYLNTYIHTKAINHKLKQIKDKNTEAKVIMYIYHFDFPDLENFLKNIKHDLLVYDCVDEYTAFPEYAKRAKTNRGIVKIIQSFDEELKIKLNQNDLAGIDWVKYREEYLARKSDLIFVSAPGLMQKFDKYVHKVHFLPNACVPEVFDINKSDIEEPSDLVNIKHPRIGFTGAIDSYKNNIRLIEKSADRYPDYSFVLIGPEKLSDPDLDLSKLKKTKNVFFLGTKEWSITPYYFAYFDAFFIPYNLNEYTVKGCFPVKYFESLAAGLPTVVTNMPAYHDYDIDGLVSKSDQEFLDNLSKALLLNSKEAIKKRKELAYANSWEGKVKKQLELINLKLHI